MADNFRIYKNERKKRAAKSLPPPFDRVNSRLMFLYFFLESVVFRACCSLLFLRPCCFLEPIGRQFGESLLVLPFSFEVAVHRIVVEPKADEVFGN